MTTLTAGLMTALVGYTSSGKTAVTVDGPIPADGTADFDAAFAAAVQSASASAGGDSADATNGSVPPLPAPAQTTADTPPSALMPDSVQVKTSALQSPADVPAQAAPERQVRTLPEAEEPAADGAQAETRERSAEISADPSPGALEPPVAPSPGNDEVNSTPGSTLAANHAVDALARLASAQDPAPPVERGQSKTPTLILSQPAPPPTPSSERAALDVARSPAERTTDGLVPTGSPSFDTDAPAARLPATGPVTSPAATERPSLPGADFSSGQSRTAAAFDRPTTITSPMATSPIAPSVTDPTPASGAFAPVASMNPSGTPSAVSPVAPSYVGADTGQSFEPLANQIGFRLAGLRTAGDGQHVLTMRVSPESIGPVKVVAHISGETVRIELIGVTDQAREALRASLSDLRRDLIAAGFPADLSLGSSTTGRGPGGGFAFAGHSGPDDREPTARREERKTPHRSARPADQAPQTVSDLRVGLDLNL